LHKQQPQTAIIHSTETTYPRAYSSEKFKEGEKNTTLKFIKE